MNAPSVNFGNSHSRSTLNASSTSMRWAALGEAGQVVAMLAGLEPERPSKEIRNFPALIRDAEKWRRDLVDNGCADLAAVMEPGITALLSVNARGANCKPAALALWREFVMARSALLALLPPTGEYGPRRSA
ncbi:hypothetical protein [Aurantiacibacter odishensis]|uniref:hypothetical protein n=1 Tax=Aurantiacibacter odishensis TaxID=1155476 RepID=UPI001F0C86D6|nr:hypothetical protein [Aurantiacibacter odishensis]